MSDAQSLRKLEDVIHAVMNSLSLISSHSQYLLGKLPDGAPARQELLIVCEEAERAASLLRLVPQGLGRTPILDPTSTDSRSEGERPGAGRPRHGAGRG